MSSTEDLYPLNVADDKPSPRRISRRDAFLAAPLIVPAYVIAAGSATAAAPSIASPNAPVVRKIDQNIVITESLVLQERDKIEIAEGMTLTLNGDFDAPASRVFFGKGKVDLTSSRVLYARPEWWGAVPNDPSTDCLPALEAALASHLWVQLGQGDYWVSRTWAILHPNRRIWGIGHVADAKGTRIVLRSDMDAVIAVGPDNDPGGINAFLAGIDMRCLVLARALPPRGGATGQNVPTGLRVHHVLHCNFEGLLATEHGIGFDVRSAVRTFLRDCTAFRSLSGTVSDEFVGFEMSGNSTGMAGVNASLFLLDCAATTGNNPLLKSSFGVRLTGTFADTVIVRFETVDVANGIAIDGQRSSLPATHRRSGHANLRVEAPILDRCSRSGISIANVSDYAAIDVTQPYIALSEAGGAAIDVKDSAGAIDVTGGQLIGWVATDAGKRSVGLDVARTQGLAISHMKMVGFSEPVVASDVTAFDLQFSVSAMIKPTAISLRNLSNGSIKLRRSGGATADQLRVNVEGKTRSVVIETLATAVVFVNGVARPQQLRRIEFDA